MRKFQAGPADVMLVSLELFDIYEGLLEGGPQMVRKFHLHSFDHRAREGGAWVMHGRDEIERDIASGSDIPLPAVRAEARLRESVAGGRRVLNVVWFQSWHEDPFDQLASVVSSIDWIGQAQYVSYDADW
jgi:hypothetical protein